MDKRILTESVAFRKVYFSFANLFSNAKREREQESERRKPLSLFDIEELAQPIPEWHSYYSPSLTSYGYARIFCGYAGIPKPDGHIYIEHGLFFGNVTTKYIKRFNDKLITYSDYRENYLNDYLSKNNLSEKKTVFKVGPYIHYVKPLLSDLEQQKLKAELGRTLLVFPSHSLGDLRATFDSDKFIGHIESLKASFDTVLICLHHSDIRLGRAAMYQQLGYKLVTAGNANDYYFLPRLKSIISLVDVTLSNDIGTHLGYCVYMGKPHSIYGQEVVMQSDNKEILAKELSMRDEAAWKECNDMREELFRLFAPYTEKISEEQYARLSYLFGFGHIKSPEEIKYIFSPH